MGWLTVLFEQRKEEGGNYDAILGGIKTKREEDLFDDDVLSVKYGTSCENINLLKK